MIFFFFLGGGGEGKTHIKATGVTIGHFERNPLKATEARYSGVAQIHFHPSEVPILE